MNNNIEEEIVKFHEQQKNDQKTPLSSQEKRGIVLLLILYFIQGLPIGFFGGTIPLILAERQVEMKKLAELQMVYYPFAFKFLMAPILDAYYFPKFGKRKTYIIPLQYILSLAFIFASYQINELIDQQDIFSLTLYGFIGCFIAASQDIAVDGWVLTIFEKEEHVGLGSTCNNVGQVFGIFISNSIFIQLNSAEFCRKYLYFLDFWNSGFENEGILNVQKFLFIAGILIFIVTLVVHFFVQERRGENKEEKNETGNIFQVIISLKGFYTNKNLRFLLFFLLSYKLGQNIIPSIFTVKLVQNGFHKETMSSMSFILIPLSFFFAILASKYIKAGQEMYCLKKAYFLKFIDNIFAFFILYYFQQINQENYNIVLILYFISSALSSFINNFEFIALGGFYNRISDLDVGGSFLTTLNSFSNFGRQFSEQFGLIACGMMQFQYVALFGWIYGIIYIILLQKQILGMQKKEKEQWSLQYNGIQKQK